MLTRPGDIDKLKARLFRGGRKAALYCFHQVIQLLVALGFILQSESSDHAASSDMHMEHGPHVEVLRMPKQNNKALQRVAVHAFVQEEKTTWIAFVVVTAMMTSTAKEVMS